MAGQRLSAAPSNDNRSIDSRSNDREYALVDRWGDACQGLQASSTVTVAARLRLQYTARHRPSNMVLRHQPSPIRSDEPIFQGGILVPRKREAADPSPARRPQLFALGSPLRSGSPAPLPLPPAPVRRPARSKARAPNALNASPCAAPDNPALPAPDDMDETTSRNSFHP